MEYEEWAVAESDLEDERYEDIERSPWRRRIIVAVAIVAATAVALVPLYNVVERSQPSVADNGLEVCGFDYCVVQDAVRDAGRDLTMSLLANTYLDDAEAERLAGALLTLIEADPISFEMVDRLDRRIAGQFIPATRTVLIERPARAWIVVHEVAHAVAPGHGDDFQAVLIGLVARLEESGYPRS